jgi:regulator of sigma E protease
MSIAVALIGLGVLIFVHELGHFSVARAVGLRPRRFYVGFPPAIVKTTRNGIEYGLGAIPLGGFVKIPGMHRPAPPDVDHHFAPAVAEAPELAGPLERLRRSFGENDIEAARATLEELRERKDELELSPLAARAYDRGLSELSDAVGPDAYWRAPTWKRLAAIAAGPAANVVLAIALFTVLLMQDTYRIGIELTAGTNGAATTQIRRVVAGSAAEAAGLQPGDRIVAVNGARVSVSELLDRIQGSEGRPLDLTLQRAGRSITIDDVRARGEGGRAFPAAVWRSVEITGLVTKEIGAALGRLVTGEGRDEISSPVGIVQGSSEAADRGTDDFLWVLGLISLSLALLNLLPLLPLDGGHIAFSLIEGARGGRTVRREVYERVSAIGIVFVVLLFVIGLSNDIGRL